MPPAFYSYSNAPSCLFVLVSRYHCHLVSIRLHISWISGRYRVRARPKVTVLRHEADIPDTTLLLIDLIIYRTQYFSNNSTGSMNTIHNLLSKKHLSFVRLRRYL